MTGEILNEARLDALFQAADERHHRRRRRTLRVYGVVNGVFFLTLLVLAILVFARFAGAILPEFS